MGVYLSNDIKLTKADIEGLPNYKKRTTSGEYSSVCPLCGGDPAEDSDRFRFWPEVGNYWCRRCLLEGFVTDGASELFRITPEMKAEWARQQKEREAEEKASQLTAIERLRKEPQPHVQYKINLNGQSKYITEKWGLQPETIDYFQLGYCYSCPTYQESSSITIPYFWHEQVINIRHRLVAPNGSGKYRPEMAGLPSAIYNADILAAGEEWVILVEGEFKAMVLHQNGLPVVAIPGANIFKDHWIKLFDKVQSIFIALDPGADEHAWQHGQKLSRAGCKVRVASLPYKPDDMLVQKMCDLGTFCRYLELGRVV